MIFRVIADAAIRCIDQPHSSARRTVSTSARSPAQSTKETATSRAVAAGIVAQGERHAVRTEVQRDEEPPAESAFEAEDVGCRLEWALGTGPQRGLARTQVARAAAFHPAGPGTARRASASGPGNLAPSRRTRTAVVDRHRLEARLDSDSDPEGCPIAAPTAKNHSMPYLLHHVRAAANAVNVRR
jgi:hypothetical protein